MESLNYIFSKRNVKCVILAMVILCYFYRLFIFNQQISTYLTATHTFFTFTLFPMLYYYLLNLYHQYIENQFIVIRYRDLPRQKLIYQLLITLTYTLIILFVEILPCISLLKSEAIFYLLDMTFFNFTVYFLFSNIIEIIAFHYHYNFATSIVIILNLALYMLLIYTNKIPVYPLSTYPNVRVYISLALLMINISLSILRARWKYV